MSRHLLRRLFATLLAVAIFSASTLQIISVVTKPMDASMTMVARHGTPDSPPMPCEGMTPGCMIDLGCFFTIAIIAPSGANAVHLAWAPFTYQRMPGADLAES